MRVLVQDVTIEHKIRRNKRKWIATSWPIRSENSPALEYNQQQDIRKQMYKTYTKPKTLFTWVQLVRQQLILQAHEAAQGNKDRSLNGDILQQRRYTNNLTSAHVSRPTLALRHNAVRTSSTPHSLKYERTRHFWGTTEFWEVSQECVRVSDAALGIMWIHTRRVIGFYQLTCR